MKELTALKFDTDGDVEVVEVTEDLATMAKAIGTNFVEIVRPALLPRPHVFIVDENGWAKDHPRLNGYATLLNGNPIAGDVLLLSEINVGTADQELASVSQKAQSEDWISVARALAKEAVTVVENAVALGLTWRQS